MINTLWVNTNIEKIVQITVSINIANNCYEYLDNVIREFLQYLYPDLVNAKVMLFNEKLNYTCAVWFSTK